MEKLKEKLLERCSACDCRKTYDNISNSANSAELMQAIKNDFNIVVLNKIIDAELFAAYRHLFEMHNIFHNKDINHGHVLVTGNATVNVSGDAIAVARNICADTLWQNVRDNCNTINTRNNAIVYIYGSATVEACDDVSVYSEGMYGNATIKAYNNVTVYAHNSVVNAKHNVRVAEADGNTEINLYDNAVVINKLSDKVRINNYKENQ
ncbi:MAG: hypothetical protein LBJ63_01210 [Prevotellaceae bacterium]|nr:hypothetical protein [Prevotellaceae bacterium]